jgi:hypothetical protein
MIGYATVGTNDIKKAPAFYDFRDLDGKKFAAFRTGLTS